MNNLMTFMYIILLIFIAAWFVQIGADPASARTTFSAIVMTICVMLIVGTVALTILSLLVAVWSSNG